MNLMINSKLVGNSNFKSNKFIIKLIKFSFLVLLVFLAGFMFVSSVSAADVDSNVTVPSFYDDRVNEISGVVFNTTDNTTISGANVSVNVHSAQRGDFGTNTTTTDDSGKWIVGFFVPKYDYGDLDISINVTYDGSTYNIGKSGTCYIASAQTIVLNNGDDLQAKLTEIDGTTDGVYRRNTVTVILNSGFYDFNDSYIHINSGKYSNSYVANASDVILNMSTNIRAIHYVGGSPSTIFTGVIIYGNNYKLGFDGTYSGPTPYFSFTNCTVYNISNLGIPARNGGTNYLINCSFYNTVITTPLVFMYQDSTGYISVDNSVFNNSQFSVSYLKGITVTNSNLSNVNTLFNVARNAFGSGLIVSFTLTLTNCSFNDIGTFTIVNGAKLGRLVPYFTNLTFSNVTNGMVFIKTNNDNSFVINSTSGYSYFGNNVSGIWNVYVFNRDVNLTISNVSSYDGVLVVLNASNIMIIDSYFVNNYRAILVESGCTIGSIVNSSFINNGASNVSVDSTDGGDGRAIYFNSSVNNGFSIIGCNFINTTTTTGSSGGAIYFNKDLLGNFSINSSNFINNSAITGGAIAFVGSVITVNINGSAFINNTATIGGAIYFNSSNVTLIYNRFYNNNATTGTAIYYTGSGNLNANLNWWGNITSPSDYIYVNGSEGILILDNYVIVGIVYQPFGNFYYNISLNDSSDFNPALLPYFELLQSNDIENISYDARVNRATRSSPFEDQTFSVDDYVYTYDSVISYSDLYVNSSSTDLNPDGSSWEKAFSNLSDALDLVFVGNLTNVTIHIAGADGGAVNYTGLGNTGLTLNDSFDGIIIIGEFGNPVFNAEGSGGIFNISAANLTLINLIFTRGVDSVYNNGFNLSVINCSFINNTRAIYNNGSGLVVNGSNFVNNTAIDGGAIYNTGGYLTVSGSNFTSNNAANGRGGAIYNTGANMTISNSIFTTNRANNATNGPGGAIYNTGGYLTVSGCNFTSNNATNGSGGAIYNSGANMTISNSIFTTNRANNATNGLGGAIYNTGTSLNVSDSKFTNNIANKSGGAIYNTGGYLSVSGSDFTSNTANIFGGAIYNYISSGGSNVIGSNFTSNRANSSGGAIYNYNTGSFNVIGSNFISNRANNGSGGAICNNYTTGSFNVNGCNFTNNNATNGSGGAIHNNRSYLSVSGSIFTNNAANRVMYDFELSGAGGAICNAGNYSNVTDSSFANNKATTGGAIYNSRDVNNTVSGCNFTGNTAVKISGEGSGDGGAISNNNGVNLTVLNSVFISNSANGSGGAIFNFDAVNVSVSNSNFTGNTATSFSGAINNGNGGNFNVTGCNFTNNKAGDRGGAIFNNDWTMYVFNSTFTGNNATVGGGAIYNHDSAPYLNVSSCNFTNNKANDGGAILNYLSTNMSVSGCNFVNNTAIRGGSVNINGGTVVLNYNRFYNNNASQGSSVFYNSISGSSLNANLNWWGNVSTESPYAYVYVDGSSGSLVFANHVIVGIVHQPSNFYYNISLNDSSAFNPALLPYFELVQSSYIENISYDARVNKTGSLFPFNQNFIVDDYVCTYAVPYNDLYVNSSNNNPDSDGSSWEKAFSNLSAALNLISMWNFSNVTIHIAGADGGAVDYTGIGVNTGFTLNNSFDRLIIIGEFGNPVFNAGGSGRIFTISATNVTLINLNITSSAGPIYSTGANLSIINCSFINNTGNSIQNTGAGLIVNGSNFIGTGATINSNNFLFVLFLFYK
ncbi:beta strand repeat-containing protein [Methanobrevibacter arboriphilus]|nr:hypothetical protein [Methanobrevibacter arboriphilus]